MCLFLFALFALHCFLCRFTVDVKSKMLHLEAIFCSFCILFYLLQLCIQLWIRAMCITSAYPLPTFTSKVKCDFLTTWSREHGMDCYIEGQMIIESLMLKVAKKTGKDELLCNHSSNWRWLRSRTKINDHWIAYWWNEMGATQPPRLSRLIQ